MFQSFFKSYPRLMLFALPIWILISFYAAQIILSLIFALAISLRLISTSSNKIILNTTFAALVYILSIFIAMGLPWLVKKIKTTKQDIGLTRLPTWTDIVMAPAGYIVYFIASMIMTILAANFLPGFNIDEVQNTGFNFLNQRYEYILAFLTLVIMAPIAEEILFRGYLYGKLKKFVPIWVAIVATSVTFGFVHGAWNLAVDTFTLSVVLCLLRESTGNIWSSILLHMIKNAVAFYFLINL